jgi:Flp pilus assembly protein TadB
MVTEILFAIIALAALAATVWDRERTRAQVGDAMRLLASRSLSEYAHAVKEENAKVREPTERELEEAMFREQVRQAAASPYSQG